MTAPRRVVLTQHELIVDRREMEQVIESMRDGAEKYWANLAARNYTHGHGYCGATIAINLRSLRSMRDRAVERSR